MESLLLGVGDPNTNPREEDVVKFANFFLLIMYVPGRMWRCNFICAVIVRKKKNEIPD